MSGLDHHLVRRGLDVARHAGALVDRQNIDTNVHNNVHDSVHNSVHDNVHTGINSNSTIPLPGRRLDDILDPRKAGAAGVILLVSLVLLVVVSLAIRYTYGLVVATLACVEDPQPNVYLAVHEDEAPLPDQKSSSTEPKSQPESQPEPDVQAALLVADRPPQPITSSLKSTLHHLRVRGGPWSRFRGLRVYLVWLAARGALARLLAGFLSSGDPFLLMPGQFARQAFADVAAEVAMTSLAIVWIHTVIAEPLAGPTWLRLPGFRAWSQVAPAAALKAAASQLGFVLPALLGSALRLFRVDGSWMVPITADSPGPDGHDHNNDDDALAVAAGGLGVLALSLLLTVLVEIPATVAMVRVAASLLPDHVESIVPFDRSFGGRAVPEEGRRLGIVSAWTTFARPARVRLAKVLLKMFAMLMMVGLSFAGVFASVQLFAAHEM